MGNGYFGAGKTGILGNQNFGYFGKISGIVRGKNGYLGDRKISGILGCRISGILGYRVFWVKKSGIFVTKNRVLWRIKTLGILE